MPSDGRETAALAILAGEHARHRAALASAAAQMREYLEAHREQALDASQAMAGELGRFAAGRIDGGRLAGLLGTGQAVSPERLRPITRAAEVLGELHARGEALFTVDVPPGGDVYQAVHDVLEEIGRAFGAALVFQSARTGVYRAEQHYAMLEAFAWTRWNRGERALAPPLVISIDGADLHAERLLEFLDGRLKLVIVVRGPATPAPLVRLVTPGTFVQQAADVAALDRLATAAGPAIVALVGEGAARFTHDPGAGRTLAERLTIEHLPGAPKGALGSRTTAQQREELEQLAALGAVAAAASHAVPVEMPAVVPEHLAVPDDATAAPAALPAIAVPIDAPASLALDALTRWLMEQGGFATAAPAAAEAAT